jgi:hypothetical protein
VSKEDDVMALLTEGQRLRSEGKGQEAREIYRRAWAAAEGDDNLCCTIAHMAAIVEDDDEPGWSGTSSRCGGPRPLPMSE